MQHAIGTQRLDRACSGPASCSGRPALVITRRSLVCRAGREQKPQGSKRVKLSFKIPYRCAFGQEVALVGSSKETGRWDVKGGVSMQWSEGDVWMVEFEVETGPNIELEYKYVIRNGANGDVVEWKPGENYQLCMPVLNEQERAIAEGVRVRDAWDGSIKDIAVEVSDLPPTAPEWSPEVEFKEMQKAVTMALSDLDRLVANTLDMGDGVDPTSPDLLNADRVVAAAARKAMQMQGALSAANSLYQQQLIPDQKNGQQ